jgi:hypothetical protein
MIASRDNPKLQYYQRARNQKSEAVLFDRMAKTGLSDALNETVSTHKITIS